MDVWKAYEVRIKGYFVGVIFGTGESDARLRAWDWFGVSTPYVECVKLFYLKDVDRQKCLRPWLTKGWKS